MKLFKHTHPEIVRLSNYFKEIESLARKNGMDIDDLVREVRERSRKAAARRSEFLKGDKQAGRLIPFSRD